MIPYPTTYTPICPLPNTFADLEENFGLRTGLWVKGSENGGLRSVIFGKDATKGG